MEGGTVECNVAAFHHKERYFLPPGGYKARMCSNSTTPSPLSSRMLDTIPSPLIEVDTIFHVPNGILEEKDLSLSALE